MEGSFCSSEATAVQIRAAKSAGCGRSADSLSLSHNGIKLITFQCDRV